MGVIAVYRKTFADLSNPKLLLAYFIPFLGVSIFLALGIAPTLEGEAIGHTVAQQEAWLHENFILMSIFLGVAIPLLALCAVFCGLTLGTECERGSLRILLSKPVKRWEVLLGTFLGIVSFALIVALANLLLTAVMLIQFADIRASAIPGSVFVLLPGTMMFALLGASVVTAVGLALAVVTKDRLQTTLGALVIPVLYFIYIPVRIFAWDTYETYHLYLFDVSHHFGHAFVVIHRTIGTAIPSESREPLQLWTGIYRFPDESNGSPGSLEVTGFVPMEISVLLLLVILVGSFTVAIRQFSLMDV
ncbi:ABC transporter permease [Natrarchaeobius chitinivorans]|uniref:ABC transporter permease n=1 Tax=Natrarchaeobius chitinivorans TaxID=1679083 RepID=A0A3N6P5I2_NATCH|nr:ABC transporter permease subunit [Natrarchaeobius chitinivorans]RQG90845.1 hypothetical protein EA473_19765 [Natrarchaeobius chitinivorans]